MAQRTFNVGKRIRLNGADAVVAVSSDKLILVLAPRRVGAGCCVCGPISLDPEGRTLVDGTLVYLNDLTPEGKDAYSTGNCVSEYAHFNNEDGVRFLREAGLAGVTN